MLLPMRMCTFIALCCLPCTAQPQATTTEIAKPPAGIFGRVVDSQTHSPVRRANIRVSTAHDQWDEITDIEGRFRFPELSVGDYRLVAHRDGYTDRAYVVEKSDFSAQKELPVELRPQALITGTVVDGSGQPLQFARVEALTSLSLAGATQVIASAETNDLGEYRLFSLNPGTYRLRAGWRGGRSSEFDPTPVRMAVSFYGVNGTRTEVSAKAGAVITGIDFTLRPVHPAVVRGTLRTESGALSEPATMWISGRDGEGGHNAGGRDGKFEIQDVGTGTYIVSAETLSKTNPMSGVATVEVHADDVDAVEIVLRPVPKIEAEIRVEGGSLDLDPGAIYLIRTEPVFGLGMNIGNPDKSGNFTLPLIPGEYNLSFDTVFTTRGIRSVTFDDKPVTNWKIQIDESSSGKKLIIMVGPRPRP